LIVVFVMPSPTGSGSAGAVLTYSGARPVADRTATGFSGGGWTLLFAAGLVAATPQSVLVNTTVLGNTTCTFTPQAVGESLSVPEYLGNRSSGSSPAWVFAYYWNSTHSMALVSVVDGQGTVLGTLTGLVCPLFLATLSSVLRPIPASAINSSLAAAAVEPKAHAFLATHANASAAYALIGGYHYGVSSVGPEWLIVYSTCSLSLSASGTGAEFNATVNATTGTVLSTNTTENASCGSGISPFPVGGPLVLSTTTNLSVDIRLLPGAELCNGAAVTGI
jgi:hypothetical protein